MAMNILLTGCAGFIGYHTAVALLDQGHTVIGLDNLNEYYDVKLKTDKLALLEQHKNFTFIQHDLQEQLPKLPHIDRVCHLAAQAGVRYSLENPFAYIQSNDFGTVNIFEYARHNNIKHVVYASSSSVYGNTKTQPFTEDMDVNTPVSLYAATKRANELMAYTYHHLFGIQMVGLRFFTVYGPWGRPDMAPMLFTKAILDDKPIKVFNEGKLSRDFTFVSDIVQGVVAAVHSDIACEVINLGRGEPVNLLEFIHILEKHIGKQAQKEFVGMQPGDVEATFADVTKANRLLGYTPIVSLDEGIAAFIAWYKGYYA